MAEKKPEEKSEVEKLSDEELAKRITQLGAEAHRRSTERQEAKERLRKERLELQQRFLTRDLVNAFVPDHDRSSCDDENVVNGWDSTASGARCKRCALLELVHQGTYMVSTPHLLTINIERFV